MPFYVDTHNMLPAVSALATIHTAASFLDFVMVGDMFVMSCSSRTSPPLPPLPL